MKCFSLILIFLSILFLTNIASYANNQQLFGQIEHNQLANANQISTFPQQANYANTIKKLLAGYDLHNALQSVVQNNLLQTTVQQNAFHSNATAIEINTKAARNLEDILANHDLAIIIDRSGSMATQDCPGKISRWQWCAKQASALAQAAAQASSSLTVMFFNDNLQIFNNVKPTNLPTLFNSYAPAGGTVLASPLIAELDKYFAKRIKPLIIVVISDGIPQDGFILAPMISDASDSLHYIGEVTISFLLVGNQVNKEQFKRLIGELDSGEIKNGGMVDVIDFKTLSTKGIKQTLYDELKTIKLSTNKSKSSKAKEFAIGQSLPLNQPLNPFPLYSSNALTNPFPIKSLPNNKKTLY